jgi:hypothetical protein
MLPVALFEDRPAHSCLSPLDDLRPACNIRTGVLTTLERACLRLDVRALLVPETLRPLTLESLALHPQGSLLGVNDRSRLGAGPCLLLNARAPLAWKAALTLKPGQLLIDPTGRDLIAAIVMPYKIDALLAGDRTGLSPVLSSSDASAFVLTRPWHLRAQARCRDRRGSCAALRSASRRLGLALAARGNAARRDRRCARARIGRHRAWVHPR